MSRFVRWITLLIALCGATAAHAQGLAAIQNHCFQGGTHAVTSGLSSTNFQQGIIPSCTVTVYLTGTQTKATIFSNATGTPLANPFTANATSSTDPGGWIFWSAVNVGYDIVMGGGISPNTYPSPVTLTDQYPSFQFSGGGGGGATPCGTNGQIQLANASGSALNCDPFFFYSPTTHTLNTTAANMLIGALSSLPRATYDPMDTRYCNVGGTVCGLAAAIAAGGTAPTQVIQAAMDYGKCQVLTGATQFPGINIPLPSGVTINITGLQYWGATSFGGDPSTFGPNLQHTDSSQVMIRAHAASDTITCNGTVYTPGGTSGVLLHNFRISGMGAVATNTDVGVLLNASSSAAVNIDGLGNGFGGPAVLSQAQSSFLRDIGYPGAQLEGCLTYNNGVLPVSGSIVGQGKCSSVEDQSLDGGMENVYATDGQAFATGHAAGPCYPNCSAIGIESLGGTYDLNLFAQVSSVGVRVNAASAKVSTVRVDYTSREGVQIAGGCGSCSVQQVKIDSPCTDTALQSNYNAHIATGCGALKDSGTGNGVSDVVVNPNAGIFPPTYEQCFIYDSDSGGSPPSNTYSLVGFQGSTNNTTPNDWAFCGVFDNTQAASRIQFPDMSPMLATGTTVNATGVTSVQLNGQTVTNIIGGIAGQHLYVWGPGTLQQGASGASNAISNFNGLNNTIAATQVVEYVQESTLANNFWQMVSGPPNQTPTHVNYGGNPTPSNPSLIDAISTIQSRQAPAFTIDSAVQIHGPLAPSGQACFVQQALFPDGSQVISDQVCTSVDLSTQTPGEVFVSFVPQASMSLWMTSNTQPNGIQTGKFPTFTCGGPCFWGNAVIAAGGDGTAPPTPGDNSTGEIWGIGSKQVCPNPLPACSSEYAQMLCTIPGSGSTADVNQVCRYQGSGTYSWQPLGAGSGGGVGPGTTNTGAMFTGTNTVGNAPWNVSGGFINFLDGVTINDGTGNGGSWTPTEGPDPALGAAGVDTCYADSTAHALLCNYNNAGKKQVPLYPIGTNSPLLQWTTSNTTTFSGTNTSGIGAEFVGAPGSTLTIDRIDMVLGVAPVGCTTAAVVSLYDETVPASPVEVSASFEITLVNGTRFYTITPGTPFALTLGHIYMWGIKTATSGCSTSPSSPYWTNTYTVQ